MRKRIEKLARGTFEYERPVLTFQVDKIELEVLEGQDYTGEFTFTSLNDLNMRGVVYTSDPRMECLTPQFEGKNVRIKYQFHSEGLMEGDVAKGDFYIIANQGEYNLSFVVDITRMYADSSIGKIRSLSDFTKLAKENFKEACKVFASKGFRNILKHADTKEVLLYEGLSAPPFYPQNVEEFLVGIGRKSMVLFSVEKKYREYYEVAESFKDTIEIKKNQWGYLEIEVESDADFLILEKENFTIEDFIGSTCQLSYLVDREKLHAGKNFARLYLHNAYQSENIEFCVSVERKDEHRNRDGLDMHSCRVKLTGLYMAYRLKRMVTGAWAAESGRILSHMQALQPENAWFPLMRAQTLLINKQRQEAKWILEDFKKKQEDRDCPVYGYYLYLSTLVEREPAFVRKMTQRIEEIYKEWDEDPFLYWVLLFLKEEYLEDSAVKLESIKQKIENGCNSPFLYLEAYYLYENDPYLLTVLGDTEVKILWWAAKQKALNKDIAIAIMNLAGGRRRFEKRIYQLLCEAYQYYAEPEMVSVICSYLIKGQCFAPAYLEWYAKAVEEELRITNLNEAYMMSLDQRSIVDVPRVIQMYFQYDGNISYSQKAALFVNIIANKEKQPGLYENYRKLMERFAMEQIAQGRIDDNLSVIYEEMLEEGFLTREIAVPLSRILYMHKISCFSSEITAAVIIQPQLKQKIRVPFNGKSGYFPLFSSEFVILLEDRKGQRYTSISYQIEKLMRPGRYLRKCLRYAAGQIEYALGFVAGKENFYSFDKKEGALLEVLLDSDLISEKYKAKLCPKILEYYSINEMEDKLDKCLKDIDFLYLDREVRRYIFALLMEKRMYDKAYLFIRNYGKEQVEPAKLVLLCSYEIEKCGYEEDDFLEDLSMAVVIQGKYNDVLLRYLCQYYRGSTRQMYEIWKLADGYDLNTFELEERILVQMLYTTEFVEGAENVFESYEMHGGSPLVEIAYLNYFSESYFSEDALVEDNIFWNIRDRLKEGGELVDACKLALLKYYAFHKELQQGEKALIDELLAEYTEKNMYFAFYKHFEKKFLLKYFLYDKIFIEYHTKEHRQVILHYCLGDTENDFKEETMEPVYAGIYGTQMTFFFGDSISYYIEEKGPEGTKITESAKITYHDMYGEKDERCYDMLNAMMMGLTLQDEKELEKLMLNYEKKKEFAREKFTIL